VGGLGGLGLLKWIEVEEVSLGTVQRGGERARSRNAASVERFAIHDCSSLLAFDRECAPIRRLWAMKTGQLGSGAVAKAARQQAH
jgi:hypothetical protein